MRSIDITSLVLTKIESLGVSKAAEYFGVSIPTVSDWKKQVRLPSLAAGQMVLNEYLTVRPPEIWNIEGKRVLILMPIYRTMNGLTHATLFVNYAGTVRKKLDSFLSLERLFRRPETCWRTWP